MLNVVKPSVTMLNVVASSLGAARFAGFEMGKKVIPF